jgi:hypothetical protein
MAGFWRSVRFMGYSRRGAGEEIEMKITPAHRHYVAKLYGIWLRRFGLQKTLRGIRLAKKFVWTENGFALVVQKVMVYEGAA